MERPICVLVEESAKLEPVMTLGTDQFDRSTVPSYLWPRPKYRGLLHAAGAFAVVPLGVLLVLAAAGATAKVGAGIYVVTQLVVFATSASYHRLAKSATARRRMQLADHSMIYLLIAGTWVPLCLLAMPAAVGRGFLVAIAGAAVVGIVLKSFGVERFKRSSSTIYIVMGWAGVFALPFVIPRMPAAALVLMAVGGIAYTLGAIVLLRKRPDPRPSVFGYHEIWHAFTVAASACHFSMVWLVATA